MDDPVRSEKSEIAKREEETLAFWEKEHIFEKTLEKKAPKGEFVFYEGPPTANGKPGIHHLEARAFKDAFTRYKTMRGYRVRRKAGWDTHGLPVEIGVEKELGFSGKPDIEKFGIAAFNKKCRESVLRYVDLWERFTKRIGYWVSYADAYFTFDASYLEVLWHVLSDVNREGRLYKDYKVVPWCPRCGTALSAHELAQGYQDVKDLTVTAKFRVLNASEKLDVSGDVYLLAWTTTPWTLPGNVALAVGPKIRYAVIRRAEGYVIVAVDRVEALGLGEANRVKEVSGEELVGLSYEPLYPYAKALASKEEAAKFEKAFQVYPADFVTTEEGTGIVHTAVMYGQEDFDLGMALGLPRVHTVNPEGRFVEGIGSLSGKSVVEEATAVDIIKDLSERGMLFSKSKYEHSYPFCWRCHTRIVYYARDSWYIRMTDLRDTLLAENKTVHWEPDYLRDGRMGEWLANVKDWAISRERYWGTPLPVWQDESGSERLVIGSVAELKERIKTNGNTYFVMRHGESEKNVADVMNDDTDGNGLTEGGKAETAASARKLRAEGGVRVIYASPLVRTRETAQIAAKELGLPESSIIFDERLRELGLGILNDAPRAHFLQYGKEHDLIREAIPDGESFEDIRRRIASFLYEIDAELKDTRVLIVTHEACMKAADVVASGGSESDLRRIVYETVYEPAQAKSVPFVPLPHNDAYELDLHRPYIDDVVLVGDSGKELRRVSEVVDVWFDSGAMPFAQDANERGVVPFEKYFARVPYPADFISEAIDQTRGWFYTLLAVGTLMHRHVPYKNVISVGHLLDAEGKKMSKSKGNVVDPWVEMDRWGADAVRFWMYSVTQPGDTKNYDEKTMREAAKTLSWIENSTAFYELFKSRTLKKESTAAVLDRWMRARVSETVRAVTASMDAYRPFEAARAIAKLAEDVSQWYVRRVRDRIRDGDGYARETLRQTLKTLAFLLAPFAPFLSERVYAATRSARDPISVHLASWPKRSGGFWSRAFNRPDRVLIERMALVRLRASEALQMRQKAGIKVRQPLAKLNIPDRLPEELYRVLADEVNVKEVTNVDSRLTLDTALTPALIAEGDERERARAVAEARKKEGFSPHDAVTAVPDERGPYVVETSAGVEHFRLQKK